MKKPIMKIIMLSIAAMLVTTSLTVGIENQSNNNTTGDESPIEPCVICEYNEPTQPEINGTDNGMIDVEYSYQFRSECDPMWCTSVRYYVDWGDGKQNTTGYYPSGQWVTLNHTWTLEGNYTIIATAQDNGYMACQGDATYKSVNISSPIPNNPPEISDPDPDDEETGVSINPTLSIYVSDPDGDTMNVSFYEQSRGLIGTDTNVSNGSRASIDWSGRDYNTTYSWYTIANDGKTTTQSDTWQFTTESAPPPIDWWPMFHHDLRHTGYSTSSSPSVGYVKWHHRTGSSIFASSAVDNGSVYCGSGNKFSCFYAENGTKIWDYYTPYGQNIESSPAVADGRVYFTSYGGYVYCVNALNGSEIWKKSGIGHSLHSSPAVTDGMVYLGAGDYKVYCLNALNGNIIWSKSIGGSVYSSPAVVDSKVYVGSFDGKVYCLYYLNGNIIWSSPTGGGIWSSPAVVDDRVYIGSEDKNVYCLYATNGTKIWNYTTDQMIRSSPAVADGRVYIGSDDGNVYCLYATNGTKIWNYTTDYRVRSSPSVADGRVYVGSDDNYIYCLDADDGSKIWSFPTTQDVYSSASIADGKAYIGSFDGWLYCFAGLPPGKPTLTGPTTGDAGEQYNYSLNATEPDGENVSYYVDWGDDSNSGWTDYVAPGIEITLNHTWDKIGTYEITAKVKDPWSNENYSDPLVATFSSTPPNPPSDPDPEDEATDVDIDADLSWTCVDPDGDTVTYDVYFGTSSPPPKVESNQTATSYDPGTMNFGTKYYWRIVAWDEHNATTAGDEWEFTTEGQAILEVTIKTGFGIGPKVVIENIGTGDANDVEWNMTVTGGILGLINKTLDGTIAKIEPDQEETVPTENLLLIGLGKITITAEASAPKAVPGSDEKQGVHIIIFTLVPK